MKPLYLIALLLAPYFINGQQITLASEELSCIYEPVNNALATGNAKNAVEAFEVVVRYYIERGKNAELPETYFGMALMLALNGYYKESIIYHKKAIRAHKAIRDDDPLEMRINLGLTYQLAGKKRKARRILGDNFLTTGYAEFGTNNATELVN
jgi:hypothetical protein